MQDSDLLQRITQALIAVAHAMIQLCCLSSNWFCTGLCALDERPDNSTTETMRAKNANGRIFIVNFSPVNLHLLHVKLRLLWLGLSLLFFGHHNALGVMPWRPSIRRRVTIDKLSNDQAVAGIAPIRPGRYSHDSHVSPQNSPSNSISRSTVRIAFVPEN